MWRPDKVERSLAAIREVGAAMAVRNATLIGAAGGPVDGTRRQIDATRGFAPCTLEPWAMVWGFSSRPATNRRSPTASTAPASSASRTGVFREDPGRDGRRAVQGQAGRVAGHIALHRAKVPEAHAGDDPRFAAPIAHWRRVHRHGAAWTA